MRSQLASVLTTSILQQSRPIIMMPNFVLPPMANSTPTPESSRWCSSPASSRTRDFTVINLNGVPFLSPMTRKRRSSCITASPTKMPSQCVQKNSLLLEREMPLRMASQSVRRQNDLRREAKSVGHSLQAMAAFVTMVESKPGSAEALKAQLRRSLPPRLPQRQDSVRQKF